MHGTIPVFCAWAAMALAKGIDEHQLMVAGFRVAENAWLIRWLAQPTREYMIRMDAPLYHHAFVAYAAALTCTAVD